MTLQTYLDKNGGLAPLARKTGLSEGFLSRVANGKRRPSIETAQIIARATGIKATVLLGLEQPKRAKA